MYVEYTREKEGTENLLTITSYLVVDTFSAFLVTTPSFWVTVPHTVLKIHSIGGSVNQDLSWPNGGCDPNGGASGDDIWRSLSRMVAGRVSGNYCCLHSWPVVAWSLQSTLCFGELPSYFFQFACSRG